MELPDELLPLDVKSGHAQVCVLESIRELGHTFGGLGDWNTYCTTVDMLGPDCPYTRIAAKSVLTDDKLRTQLETLQKALTAWLMI